MLNQVIYRWRENRRFFIALCISCLLHGVILFSVLGTIAHTTSPFFLTKIQVRLTASSVTHSSSIQEQEVAMQQDQLPVPQRGADPDLVLKHNRNPAGTMSTNRKEKHQKGTPGTSDAMPQFQEAPTNVSVPVVPSIDRSDQAIPSGIPVPVILSTLQHVEIDFEIFSGASSEFVGKARHQYVSDKGEHFGVSVEQIPDASYSRESWKLEVSGRISGDGKLSPELFSVRGETSERLMALKDSLPASSRSLPSNLRQGRIRDGILDRQSLLYYFMFRPPDLSGGQMWLTDGANLELYTYRVAGIEGVSLKSLGAFQTVKLIFSTDKSSEIIEIWLAPDAHYLPLRVRHTDKKGTITEQFAVSLTFR